MEIDTAKKRLSRGRQIASSIRGDHEIMIIRKGCDGSGQEN